MEKTAGCNYFPRVERRKMIWVIVSQCPEMVPLSFRLGVIIFGSVRFLSKKITKPKFFFVKKKPKPNQNRVKPTGFGSVRFFRAKTGSNRFGSVFPVLARFFWFGSVFPVWLGFGSVWLGFFWFFVGFGAVWFFQFFVYKTEPAGFFKKLIGLIGFFFRFGFFDYFFFSFLGLIGFPVFLLIPNSGALRVVVEGTRIGLTASVGSLSAKIQC